MAANMNYKNFGRSQPPPPPADGGGNTLLSRQTSIYSLTFDELQSIMGGTGKDFGSMNMDELLKNIWSAEETQTMASAGGGLDGNGGLQRQGSLTLPRTLNQKTVDEVWKDISKEYSFGKDGIGTAGTKNDNNNMPQRQQTLGEMTLEEFLVRAGVVREDAQFPGKVNNVDGGFFDGFQQAGSGRAPNLMGNGVSEGGNPIGFQASDLPFNVNGVNSNHHPLAQQQTQHQQQQRHQQPIFPKEPVVVGFGSQLGNPGNRGGTTGIGDQELSNGLIHCGGLGMVGLGSPIGVPTGCPANQLSSNGIGKSSADNYSLSPVPYVFNGGLRGRKSSAVEKVVERRQRRMIKNRESAARSRARKQVYTTELEEEVAKLKEENEELQKQNLCSYLSLLQCAEIMEMQENQVLETMNTQQGAKKRCLRRTVTGPW